MDSEKSQKVAMKYECKCCHYYTSRSTDFNKHLATDKHRKRQMDSKVATMDSEKSQTYQCICKNIYKYESGYYKHKKKCIAAVDKSEQEPSEKELILLLLKDNKALQELVIEQSKNMMEICKNGTNNNNHNTTHSHNKTFNLQFFLNEECKDALNISEFVSSIKMDLEDLETTGKLGYVEGVSRIINKNLHDLDQTKRPIHCSDVKREVLYIKNDEDQWVKENECKPVLTKAIKQVARENIKQISEWQKMHPDCNDPDSRNNDLYLNIVSNAMSGGSSDEQSKNYERIITNLAKEVTIEKV